MEKTIIVKDIQLFADEFEERGYDPYCVIIPAVQANRKFGNIVIQTTRNENEIIYEELSKRTKENLKELWRQSYDFISNVTEEWLIAEDRTDPTWIAWKDNLLVFYICRFILLNKPLPILVIHPSLL